MIYYYALNFRNVLSIDEYASYFDNIDPLAQYKKWTDKLDGNQSSNSKHIALSNDPCSQRVAAVFVVSDSVDWSRDIQVFFFIISDLQIQLVNQIYPSIFGQ